MLTNRDRTAVLDYDLRQFDVDEIQRATQNRRNRERAKKLENPNTSLSKKGNWFVLIMLAAFVLFVLFIYIHSKIELHQINSETTAVSARLVEAEKENIRLRTSLESMATPAKVEEYAAANGLMREKFSQVTHITVNIEKVAEVAETDGNGLLGAINSRIDDVLEFLGIG